VAEEELVLGRFNLSALWQEAVSQGNFKHFVNGLIRKRMGEVSRRGSPFDLPIVKIAAATPHLLSFDNKYALFKSELKRLRGRAKYDPIHICLKRADVF
jgi:cytochrome c556